MVVWHTCCYWMVH